MNGEDPLHGRRDMCIRQQKHECHLALACTPNVLTLVKVLTLSTFSLLGLNTLPSFLLGLGLGNTRPKIILPWQKNTRSKKIPIILFLQFIQRRKIWIIYFLQQKSLLEVFFLLYAFGPASCIGPSYGLSGTPSSPSSPYQALTI